MRTATVDSAPSTSAPLRAVVAFLDRHGRHRVHDPDCGDLSRERESAQGPAVGYPGGQTAAQIAADLYSDFIPDEMEYAEALQYVEFLPCCKEEQSGADTSGVARQTRRSRPVARGNGVDGGANSPHTPGSSNGRAASPRAKASNRDNATEAVPVGKAQAFADDATEAGWEVALEVKNGRTTVTAGRGPECIKISWVGEACQNGSTYTHGPYTKTLRNAAACRRALATPASSSPPTARTPGKPRTAKPATATTKPKSEAAEEDDYEEPKPPKRHLPFKINSPAEDIMKSVVGKEIVWKNKTSGAEQSARVGSNPSQRQLRVEFSPRNRKRVLTWAAEDQGFRSVYLESIIAVKS